MLVRSDIFLTETEGDVQKVLAIVEYKRASTARGSVFVELNRVLPRLGRGDSVGSIKGISRQVYALVIEARFSCFSSLLSSIFNNHLTLSAPKQAAQACDSAKTPLHLLNDNHTHAVLLYDTATTPPRILISLFQSTAPSFFRVLLSSFYLGFGAEDWLRDLLSRKRSEEVEPNQSAAGGEAADEGGRTTVGPELEPVVEDSGEGAEDSGELRVRTVLSSFRSKC